MISKQEIKIKLKDNICIPKPFKASIFDRIGGEGALEMAIDSFTIKVIDDPTLRDFFQDGVSSIMFNTQKVGQHMKWFMIYAFGGPSKYNGKSLREIHAKLNLDESNYEQLVGHYLTTLNELGLDEITVKEITISLSRLANEILNR